MMKMNQAQAKYRQAYAIIAIWKSIGCALALTLLCALQLCCQKTSPLQSLYERNDSETYTLSFWLHESSLHSALWLQAKHICATTNQSDKPNCVHVRAAASLAHESIAKSGFRAEDL